MEKKMILTIIVVVLVVSLIFDMVFFSGTIVVRKLIPGIEDSEVVSSEIVKEVEQKKQETIEKKVEKPVIDFVCGDGNCDEGETCCLDCGCPTGFWCEDMKCIPRPKCGDGVCNAHENCGNCFVDCKCEKGSICVENKCQIVVCQRNRDCDDNDACTLDRCYFAGDKNAYCGHEDVTECKDKDGCCPQGCTFDNDLDCA